MKLPVLRHLNLTQFLVPGKVIASTFCFCILINQNVFFFFIKITPLFPLKSFYLTKSEEKGHLMASSLIILAIFCGHT